MSSATLDDDGAEEEQEEEEEETGKGDGGIAFNKKMGAALEQIQALRTNRTNDRVRAMEEMLLKEEEGGEEDQKLESALKNLSVGEEGAKQEEEKGREEEKDADDDDDDGFEVVAGEEEEDSSLVCQLRPVSDGLVNITSKPVWVQCMGEGGKMEVAEIASTSPFDWEERQYEEGVERVIKKSSVEEMGGLSCVNFDDAVLMNSSWTGFVTGLPENSVVICDLGVGAAIYKGMKYMQWAQRGARLVVPDESSLKTVHVRENDSKGRKQLVYTRFITLL